MRTCVIRLVLNELSTETMNTLSDALTRRIHILRQCIEETNPSFAELIKSNEREIETLSAQIRKIDNFLAQ